MSGLTRQGVKNLQTQLRDAGLYRGKIDGIWLSETQAAFDLSLARARQPGLLAPVTVAVSTGPLTRADYLAGATALGGTLRQLMAVVEVESRGGWFTDVRKDILDADGPGGLIDGSTLPKILFEAHVFSRLTKRKYDASHPDISSRKWNKALYKGGQAEYLRLARAMELDRDAALQSASWGMFQVMGFNWEPLGYASVEEFVALMKSGEAAHLDSFVRYIRANKMEADFRRISDREADCTPFALGYNGAEQNVNDYDGKIARAHRRLVNV